MAGDSGQFHDAYDVVVVGYGYAGGIAAIEAHDAGAKVLLVDKMANPGGISVCSYGAMRSAPSYLVWALYQVFEELG